jgi:hypothetical protein
MVRVLDVDYGNSRQDNFLPPKERLGRAVSQPILAGRSYYSRKIGKKGIDWSPESNSARTIIIRVTNLSSLLRMDIP